MRRIALALMLVATTCLSADVVRYVDATAGNDAWDGTEPAYTTGTTGPKATMSSATGGMSLVISAGAGTHKLYVKKGTYTTAYYSLSTLANTAVVTIEGYATTPGDGATAQLAVADQPVLATTNADYCVYAFDNGTFNTGTITYRNIKFAPSALAGGDALFRWGAAGDDGADVSLALDMCTLVMTAGNNAAFLSFQTTDVATPATRTITITDCTFTGHAGCTNVINVRDIAGLTVTDCTMTGGTAANNAFIYAAAEVPVIYAAHNNVGTIGGMFLNCAAAATQGLVQVDLLNNSGAGTSFFYNNNGVSDNTHCVVQGNTWTGAGLGVSLGVGQANETRGGYWIGPQIIGNSFTMSGSGAHGIMLGANCRNAEIRANVCNVNNEANTFGIVLKGAGHVTRNVCKARYALYLIGSCWTPTGGSSTVVDHNTFIGPSITAFAWGPNANGPAAGATGTDLDTDGSATVTVDAGKDLSKVQVGDVLQIGTTTSGLNGTNYYLITAVDDTADTITVTPTPSNDDDNQTWYTFLPGPLDAVVTDNIFYGVACPAAICGGDAHWNIRMDRNLYYRTNAGDLVNVLTATDFAGLQAAWMAGAWADSLVNDVNSVNANPLFVNYVGADYHVYANSPAALTSDPNAVLGVLGGKGAYPASTAIQGSSGIMWGSGVVGEAGVHGK